jgi:hypothetical protein
MWISTVAPIAALAALASAQLDNAFSPPSYPSPWMRGGNGWQDAYAKAQAFVSQLTLLEKVNLTTGVGWEGEACVGNTGSIPRLGFRGLCMQDSPLGVRFSKHSNLPIDAVHSNGLRSGSKFCFSIGHEYRGNMDYTTLQEPGQCNGIRTPRKGY